jgi:hypothetical protein
MLERACRSAGCRIKLAGDEWIRIVVMNETCRCGEAL